MKVKLDENLPFRLATRLIEIGTMYIQLLTSI